MLYRHIAASWSWLRGWEGSKLLTSRALSKMLNTLSSVFTWEWRGTAMMVLSQYALLSPFWLSMHASRLRKATTHVLIASAKDPSRSNATALAFSRMMEELLSMFAFTQASFHWYYGIILFVSSLFGAERCHFVTFVIKSRSKIGGTCSSYRFHDSFRYPSCTSLQLNSDLFASPINICHMCHALLRSFLVLIVSQT